MTATVALGERVWSGSVLDRRAERLAGGIAAAGLDAGDVVAVLLRNEVAYLDTVLACRIAGTYYCALNWHLAPAEIGFILRDCCAKLLLADTELLMAAGDAVPAGLQVIAGGPDYEAWLAAQPVYAGAAVTPRGHMAYTSGTTGRPKGIRRTTVDLAEWPALQQQQTELVEATMGITPGCTALMTAPLYHSAPCVFAQNALRLCEKFVLMPRFDAEETLALIERHRVTTAYLVPVMYSRLLALPADVRAAYDLSSLRFVASTGAPCAPHLKRAIIDWFGPVIHESYASSETGMITVIGAVESLARPGSAGRPFGTASIRILDEDGGPCAPGETGLIYVRQPAYPDFTYNHQPEARAAIERDGHISVGDMGRLDAEGYLFVSDRASDMVISGGVNIYPAEIEHAMMQQPGILDCAVFGIPDAEFGECLHALVQAAPGAALSAEGIQAALRRVLAGFKVPRSLALVDSLPRDPNGKLAKRRLRAPYWAEAGRQI